MWQARFARRCMSIRDEPVPAEDHVPTNLELNRRLKTNRLNPRLGSMLTAKQDLVQCCPPAVL